jgi:hypothetical protein
MSLLLIGQEASGSNNLIWWLIPLLCCYLAFGQRGESSKETEKEIETFYTVVNIDESFEVLMEKIEVWRLDEKKCARAILTPGLSICSSKRI